MDSALITMLADILIVIGGLNWLIIGLLNKDYIAANVGSNATYIYIIIGLATVYALYKKLFYTERKVTTSA